MTSTAHSRGATQAAAGGEQYELLLGDAVQVMRGLPANSVQCVITSPPYYSLRDYGTASWEGGDAECDHRETDRRNSRPKGSFHGGNDESQTHPYRDICGKCGARRVDQQIGLEETPEAYVAKLVDVFREVRRVLHPSGTCWIVIGDSYNGSGKGPKQLLGMPWRVAFALQADGWILRSEITWVKRAPMPESVLDRPTSATEKVFLLAKSQHYYYDQVAVREPASQASIARISQPNFANQTGGPKDYRNGVNPNRSMRQTLENFAENPGRNMRNYIVLGPEPSSIAHFATMPTKLVEPFILAGSSSYGACGAKKKMLKLRDDLTESEREKVIAYLQSKRLT